MLSIEAGTERGARVNPQIGYSQEEPCAPGANRKPLDSVPGMVFVPSVPGTSTRNRIETIKREPSS